MHILVSGIDPRLVGGRAGDESLRLFETFRSQPLRELETGQIFLFESALTH
jgi:hypothetical protein